MTWLVMFGFGQTCDSGQVAHHTQESEVERVQMIERGLNSV